MSTTEPATNFIRCQICKAPNKPNRQGYAVTRYRVGQREFVQVHLSTCPAGWRPQNEESTDE